MPEMNRREFVVAATAACAACICSSALAGEAPPKGGPVDAGVLTDYAKDGIYDAFAEKHRFFVIRRGGKVYAMANLCTHKNFRVAIDEEDKSQLKCEKHGSLFSGEGIVTKGPAKKALPRYAISINDKGRLIVDTSKPIDQKDWEKAGSFVKA